MNEQANSMAVWPESVHGFRPRAHNSMDQGPEKYRQEKEEDERNGNREG